MSGTETLVETPVEVDLDLPVVCQAVRSEDGEPVGCASPAVWVRTYVCCGKQRTYCELHRAEVLDIFNRYVLLHCMFCGAEYGSNLGSGTWRKL